RVDKSLPIACRGSGCVVVDYTRVRSLETKIHVIATGGLNPTTDCYGFAGCAICDSDVLMHKAARRHIDTVSGLVAVGRDGVVFSDGHAALIPAGADLEVTHSVVFGCRLQQRRALAIDVMSIARNVGRNTCQRAIGVRLPARYF